MEQIVSEELNRIKSLFDYKKGIVISEQNSSYQYLTTILHQKKIKNNNLHENQESITDLNEIPPIDGMENSFENVKDKPKFSKTEYNHYVRYGDKSKFKTPEEELEYSLNNNKKCNKCKNELSLNKFSLNTSGSSPFNKDGLRYRRGDCVDCHKKQVDGKNIAKKIAKSLGIDKNSLKDIKCEICGKTDKIVFDHDHEKNEFRGWLCDGCNRSIGMLSVSADGSDLGGLIKSIMYLIKNEKNKDKKHEIYNKLLELINQIDLKNEN